MFTLKRWFDADIEIYELSEPGGTMARIVPARGGIVAEFVCWGVPVFYMDKDTLRDFGKNIRGGNPVLFPICGPLEQGKYILKGGRHYSMKQHGLARNMHWQVVEVNCGEDSSRITLETCSDEKTKQAYPFDFKLVFTYVLEPGRLIINQTYFNNSQEEMPFYAGFHPYFFASGEKAVSLDIPSREYFDLKDGVIRSFEGTLDLNSRPETNLVFSNLVSLKTGFDRPDGWRITVRYDESFRYIVLWTLRDKEFLCLEPWMGNNYDLNRGQALSVAPGKHFSASVSYGMDKIKGHFSPV